MTRKTKGRNGGDRATRKTTYKANHIATASRSKSLFVGAVRWGLLAVNLAEWIIGRFHLAAA